ncbi:MAG: protein kinase [Phycisphaerales bacterium]
MELTNRWSKPNVTGERYRRASSIFQRVCDLPMAERERVMDTECAGDERLRTAVADMLAMDEPTDSRSVLLQPSRRDSGRDVRRDVRRDAPVIDTPPTNQAASGSSPELAVDLSTRFADTSDPQQMATEFSRRPARTAADPAAALPVRIGRYAIAREIGRGGMGIVYRGRQARPRRDVALKLLDLDQVGPSGMARFRREAELLGRLQHPGIAQIHEAGADELEDANGHIRPDQPFIAMELIDGVKLTEALATATPRERMAVLAEICDAIQYAHQRKIAHLDLKPANILVDRSGRPRVLDFGVAIALDVDLERSLTGVGTDAVAGTLAYMSPEQIRGEADRIDTRADIHALGAIGFELLTGQTPYDVRRARLVDAIQLVMSSAPRPIRSIDPSVDVELAAVIDTAVAAEQDQRYDSAAALAADLRRWLGDVPVAARPASVVRGARLFARRRRALVVLAAVALLGLVTGVTAMAVGLVRAHRAEALAVREALAARAAEQLALDEAEKAQAMSGFMRTAIFGLDPELAGRQLTFFDAIDHAARQVHDELAEYPDVEASVRQSLGIVYRRHARYPEAEGHLRQALRLRRARSGPDHVDTAAAMVALSNQVFEHGGRDDEALLLLEEAVRIQAAAGRADELVGGWLALDLGLVHLARDEPDVAQQDFERCRALLAQHLGPDNWNLSRADRGLAAAHLSRGDVDLAVEVARRAVALCEGVPGAEYVGARARLVLCAALIEGDRLDEARAVLVPATAVFDRRVSARHVRRGELELIAARLARADGRYAVAILHARRCVDLRTDVLLAGHPSIFEADVELARAEIGAALAAESTSTSTPTSASTPEARSAAALPGEARQDDAATAALAAARASIDAISDAAEHRLGPDHETVLRAIHGRAEAWAGTPRGREYVALLASRQADRQQRIGGW